MDEVTNFNPKFSKALINKTVKITTVNGKTHEGILYVVDPISNSVVTVNKHEEKYDVNIFMGQAIESLSVCSSNENTIEFPSNTNKNNEDLSEKKTRLKSWLTKNLFDVQEDGLTLKVGQDLSIEPPYDKTNCCSSNTIILQRIQDIISKMPDT